jgi:hypothetical protein
LIETETGRISVALSETFPSAASTSILAEKLAESLLKKIKEKYPVRGKVKKIEGDNIILNIGQQAGVEIGQQFKDINEEFVLEVVAVQSDESIAKIITDGKRLTEGKRIEAL